MTAVWAEAPYRGGTLIVLLALADWCNDDGICWPAISTLARKTRQSESNVRSSLRALERDGAISTERNAGPGTVNLYRLHVHSLPVIRSRKPLAKSKRGGNRGPNTGGGQDSGGQQRATPPPTKQGFNGGPETGPNPLIQPSIEPSILPALIPCINVASIDNQTGNEPGTNSSGQVSGRTGPGSADPRHNTARDLILRLHRETFKVACEWDGAEGKALAKLLSLNRSWTESQLGKMIFNRFASDDIPSDRPSGWLRGLGTYAAGPLDRFRKLKGGTNGSRAEQRQSGNLAARESARQKVVGSRPANHPR
jgi:hypothetical protein